MKSINKLKIPSGTKLMLYITHQDGSPYAATSLPMNKWRKMYNKYVSGLESQGLNCNIFLMDVDDNNQCKEILFKDTLN